jgi:hypothetical protein
MAIENTSQDETMRTEIREAVHSFLSQYTKENINEIGIWDSVKVKIIALACFCAMGRCAVPRTYHGQLLYDPEPEGPSRLAKQFILLGLALARIRGQTELDDKIYQVLTKVGIDLLPRLRAAVLRKLFTEGYTRNNDLWIKTREIADRLIKPTSTVKLVSEDLMIVGLLDRLTEGDGDTIIYKWSISTEGYRLMMESELWLT